MYKCSANFRSNQHMKTQKNMFNLSLGKISFHQKVQPVRSWRQSNSFYRVMHQQRLRINRKLDPDLQLFQRRLVTH